MDGYAVIDVETTGFSPSKHDRIVEIAVVQLSERGELTGEWCTLINPERDPGPRHVHGISAADLVDAPRFGEVAGTLVDLLAGRILVAHNAPFDTLFLAAEFQRAGVLAPVDREWSLCTMRLADRYLPVSARSLAACCAAAGVEQFAAHEALDDARAAAALLRVYLDREGHPAPWVHLATHTSRDRWPNPSRSAPARVPVQRGHRCSEPEGSWVDRLVAHLPRVKEPPVADSYLDLLDRALLDRHVSETEKRALTCLASELGLDREQVLALHQNYLTGLAIAAWADGTVTPLERADLDRVAHLLGLTDGATKQALEASRPDGEGRARVPRPRGGFDLAPGDRVVFTGDMVRSREEWIQLALRAGLTVGGVTKQTKVVVAADPDSMSGKARKARQYGLPIVSESGFTELFGRFLRQHGADE